MIANIYNRTVPSNTDVLRNILSFLPKASRINFGLVSQDYLYAVETQRRREVQQARFTRREYNQAEEVSSIEDDTITFTRSVGTDIYSTSYIFYRHTPSSNTTDKDFKRNVRTIKNRLNGILHGPYVDDYREEKLIKAFKHGKEDGYSYFYDYGALQSVRFIKDGNILTHTDYYDDLPFEEHHFDEEGNRTMLIHYYRDIGVMMKKEIYKGDVTITIEYDNAGRIKTLTKTRGNLIIALKRWNDQGQLIYRKTFDMKAKLKRKINIRR